MCHSSNIEFQKSMEYCSETFMGKNIIMAMCPYVYTGYSMSHKEVEWNNKTRISYIFLSDFMIVRWKSVLFCNRLIKIAVYFVIFWWKSLFISWSFDEDCLLISWSVDRSGFHFSVVWRKSEIFLIKKNTDICYLAIKWLPCI